MKKVSLLVVMAMIAIIAVPRVLAAEVKVAVMNLNTVIEHSDAGKAANAELAVLIESKQKQVDAKGAVIEQLNKELSEKGESLKPEEKEAKQAELDQLIVEYQQLAAQAEAEIQARAQELRNQILAEIGEVLRIIGDRAGYTMILDISMVHYYSHVIDITTEVIRTYNQLRG